MGKSNLFSWKNFWANNLVTATVETAAPTNIVVTFNKSAKPLQKLVKTQFSLTGTAKTIGSISVVGLVLTITVTAAYVAGNTASVVFTPLNKAKTYTKAVTNNVA